MAGSACDRCNFQGKRVLATGAAGGLGRAFVRAFAEPGATALLADLDRARMARAAAELAPDAGCLAHDQGDLASVEALAREAGPVGAEHPTPIKRKENTIA